MCWKSCSLCLTMDILAKDGGADEDAHGTILPSAKEKCLDPPRKKLAFKSHKMFVAAGDTWPLAFKVTMVITFYMFLKSWATAFIQGWKSGKAGDRTQEDLKFYGHTAEGDRLVLNDSNDALQQDATRWRRIVQ